MATFDGRPEQRLDDRDGCTACDNPDADSNFVQCDACDRWWHFVCAGVTESVNDRAWICSHCVATLPVNPDSPTPPSNRSTSSVQRNLALLKQRQELERQRMEHQLKQKFLDEQWEVINRAMQTPSQGNHRVESRIDDRIESNPQQEDSALDNEQTPIAAALPADRNNPNHIARNEGVPRGQQNTTNMQNSDVVGIVREIESKLKRLQLQSVPPSRELNELRYQVEQCKNRLGFETVDYDISPLANGEFVFPQPPGQSHSGYQQPRNLGAIRKGNMRSDTGNCFLYESGTTNKVYANAPRKSSMIPNNIITGTAREQQRGIFGNRVQDIPSVQQHYRVPLVNREQQFVHPVSENVSYISSPGWYDQQQQANVSQNGPTQRQIAARQSLARDLPHFSGDPADWPIFISNYEYTTTACGYTNGENMLRLQRCLKGPALETVRSRLVLPAAVPQVIEALRRRYGRPELLINALLEKVRKIPAPKPDRLEGLIEYGMAVQALCDHIEAANEHVHLSNPMLLQELVGKLPADQKLMWAAHKRYLAGKHRQ